MLAKLMAGAVSNLELLGCPALCCAQHCSASARLLRVVQHRVQPVEAQLHDAV